MNMIEHAEKELALLMSESPGDCVQKLINDNVMELIHVFDKQAHSELSGAYALNAFNRLARFLPLRPLTSSREEWDFCMKQDDGTRIYSNKRCPSVFMQVSPDGTLIEYRDMAVNVSDDGGFTWFKSNMHYKVVQMPYAPPTEPYERFIENTENGYIDITDNKKRQEELRLKTEATYDAE